MTLPAPSSPPATPPSGAAQHASSVDLDVLAQIQQRILWLAVRMVDHANRERPQGEIKVGGHQASSASMVGIMTALWFGHLSGNDKVAVKPHASPVYHAIKYLTGELDRSYLTRLRQLGGLQAYPSRTKDPDVADFSTGSVGLGVVAPLFAAAARRYIESHDGPTTDRPARFVALAGDAELDEGNVWEAIADRSLQGLGNVMWVVDANRQSLDRVVPGQKIKKLMEFFDGAGWHVVEAKYGRRLQTAFAREGGDALRRHIDEMSNEEYQSLFAFQGAELRSRVLTGADASVGRFLDQYDDSEIGPLVQNLAGHDLGELIESYRRCDEVTDRPSVVFAYTVKGWGLPMAGDPLNHAALLSGEQIDRLRADWGLDADTEWDRFDPHSPAGRVCAALGGEINNEPPSPRPVLPIPDAVGGTAHSRPGAKPVATQETFGRLLTRLAEVPEVAAAMVTTSPDVSVSTNLGGWINKMGVFDPDEQPDFLGDERLLRWKQAPAGRHIELGISEMNLFLMLHALGLGHELHGRHLLPIGTVYDPFVCRGLDALIYALYNGSRFVVVGTPAGISLAPEGGAHQSSITPSIGLELPGLDSADPAYAYALAWLMCDGLQRLADPHGTSLYLRLSTRPLDQGPFTAAVERIGHETARDHVLAGGYRLVEPAAGAADVVLVGCGAVMPEVVAAAAALEAEDVGALVLDLTSPDRVYRGWRHDLRQSSRDARPAGGHHHLARLLHHHERHLPIVTVHDAASHHLAWLGSVFGARVVPVGVDEFGQSGSIPELYGSFDLLPDQLVNAALLALT
ncbi:1-deoxy-D-xylulose-5-phosphate synthase N-terminal domain-containing protein [soil metagenome]